MLEEASEVWLFNHARLLPLNPSNTITEPFLPVSHVYYFRSQLLPPWVSSNCLKGLPNIELKLVLFSSGK